MDSPASHRISVPGGTQVPSESQSVFAYGTITLCGSSFQKLSANHLVCNSHLPGPTTPPAQARAVWADPRSLATTSGIISFPLGNKMFQFPRFPYHVYVFNMGYTRFTRVGFPIRKSPDIAPAHGFPRLIAVYHVLLRHLTPRHPPYALSSFVKHLMRRN